MLSPQQAKKITTKALISKMERAAETTNLDDETIELSKRCYWRWDCRYDGNSIIVDEYLTPPLDLVCAECCGSVEDNAAQWCKENLWEPHCLDCIACEGSSADLEDKAEALGL